MKFIWSILLALLLWVVSIGSWTAAAQPPDDEQDIQINWAFGALVGPEDSRKLIPITKDTSLKTGDQFKMMVELKSMCFVYLIYSGSNGEVQILFPNNISQLNKSYPLAEKYYIPQGDLWFALDEKTGLETFYLLVSKSRLTDLEELLKKYELSSSDKKPDTAQQVENLIKQINRKRKTLAVVAERPIQIGGVFRNAKDKSTSRNDIATLAVELSATDFYSRTFTIEHK